MFDIVQVSREEAVLSVGGPLTAENSSELQNRLQQLLAGSSAIVTLDLSRTESINSSALGKILLFRQKLAERNRTLQIKGCSDSLYSTFQIINFDSLVHIQR